MVRWLPIDNLTFDPTIHTDYGFPLVLPNVEYGV